MATLRQAFVIVIAVVAGGCTGGDDATGARSSTTTSSTTLGTIPAPPAQREAPTTTPSTNSERVFPEPDWPTVRLPTGPDMRPVGLTLISDEPGAPTYDIAPDGEHLVRAEGFDRLCIASTSDPADTTCADVSASYVSWSPDGSRVLFNTSSFRLQTSGPLGTLTTGGDVDILLATADEDSPFGGAVDAAFLDAEHVIYTRVLPGDAWLFEVHVRSVDGSVDEKVGELDLGGERDLWVPVVVAFDDRSVYFRAGGPNIAAGIWRYEPVAGSIGRIKAEPEFLFMEPTRTVAVRGDVLLSADDSRLSASTSNRDEARFFDLTTIDGASTVHRRSRSTISTTIT